MRKKECRIVMTFHTTTEAMAAEKKFQQQKIPGRMIPVPREITAGCGLAWSAPAECWAALKRAADMLDISYEECRELML